MSQTLKKSGVAIIVIAFLIFLAKSGVYTHNDRRGLEKKAEIADASLSF